MLSPDLQRIKHIRDYCVEMKGPSHAMALLLIYLMGMPTISVPLRFVSYKLES